MISSKIINKELNQIRKKLNIGIPSIGSWLQLNNTSVGAIIAKNNFDWLTLDLEHGDIDEADIPLMVNSIQYYCPLVFARIRSPQTTYCSRALDLGVNGIIIPKIESFEQINNLRESIYYPPYGCRGVGYANTNLFGENLLDHLNELNEPFIVPMIETKKGVEELESILRCKGIDAILIGPYDLSASYGVPGEIQSEIVKEKVDYILKTCKKFAVPAGLHIVEPDEKSLNEAIKKGFTFLPYSIDTVFLRKASKKPNNIHYQKK
ncbi:HpcH/HpaI aldolase family protein [Prochlorococcus marinus]|jgi:2-dehydro-3-deoxyglucarate aldolase|uniref:2,4-dihydroxyhept-2-ene-1,7-dioic acid aldolase n=1 Tax=Prochlorococcus marinus (strain MIT 9301) TaxID=167546 RepID=A3PE50_PROM0|nr:aldolase/citrate lyase family protein [Prochlorococcus marinus]ABO18025.1 2,4-dihydroxyhept-2-ene-1,7-dioic acid aldolase [Prochlorococcus marinus str. MIT 9301]